jgi:hypothetical protein
MMVSNHTTTHMMPKLHAAVSSDNSPVSIDRVERADEELCKLYIGSPSDTGTH